MEEERKINMIDQNRLYQTLSIVLFIFVCNTTCYSQFEGGEGDGALKSSTIQISLNGDQINPLALYLGGQGDGNDKSFAPTTLNGGLITSLYKGGTNDGNAKNIFSGSLLGEDITTLYMGGLGDGHSKIKFEGILNGGLISSLYMGGNGDGFHKTLFSGVLDGQELADLYQGGEGDGFNKIDAVTLLDGQTLDQLYSGGEGDGFDKENFEGLLDGFDLANLYKGGDGDGFSKHMIQYIFDFPGCTFVVNTDDNGFGSLRYAINCAAPGDTIDFSPLLLQDSIVLTSSNLEVTKDIFINGIKTAELTVDASQVSRVMKIGNANIVTIKGLKLIVGTEASGGAALNSGLLTLVDVDIYDPLSNATSVIQNSMSGSLTIRGVVTIQEN